MMWQYLIVHVWVLESLGRCCKELSRSLSLSEHECLGVLDVYAQGKQRVVELARQRLAVRFAVRSDLSRRLVL